MTTVLDKFESRIQPSLGGCWKWTGSLTRGYGVIYPPGEKRQYAHRWSYEYHRDEIPAGLEIDHLCRNTWCVNPWHMEPVTHQVNILRSTSPMAQHARQTHCIHGHEFTPENTYMAPRGRNCRTCRRHAEARRRQRIKESA